MKIKEKLKLMKEIEQRNEQRWKEFKRQKVSDKKQATKDKRHHD